MLNFSMCGMPSVELGLSPSATRSVLVSTSLATVVWLISQFTQPFERASFDEDFVIFPKQSMSKIVYQDLGTPSKSQMNWLIPNGAPPENST